MKRTILSLAIIALSSSSLADTINFDSPSQDYQTDDTVNLGAGSSLINANNVEINNYLYVNADGDGSLKITANKFQAEYFTSSLKNNSTKYNHVIDISNNFSLNESGLKFYNDINSSNLRQDITINAKELEINSNNYGIHIETATSSQDKGPSAINTSIAAESVYIDAGVGSQYGSLQAIYLAGTNQKYQEDNGVYLKIEASDITLKGGQSYGATYSDNLAIYATKNAVLDILGDKEGASLNIEAKQINPPTLGTFGNMSVMAKNGAQVNIKYQENSTLDFTGGLFAFGSNDDQNANITIETQEGSQTSISGSIIAALGDVSIKTNGNTFIDAADIMSQSGVISIDLGNEAIDSSKEYGIKGNLNASYGDILGDSIVNIRLSGKNNVFTGTSYIDEDSSIDHNKVNIVLNDEARWDVEGISDSVGNPVNNHVSTLSLNNGILNISYNNQSGEFKTVEAENLSGNDGLIVLGLNWTESVEENDKLLVTKGGDAGLHKVQVISASSGIEAPQSSMSGYLIQVANPDNGLNFVADNTRLEQGVYFKDYSLDQRTLDSGAKEWFLSYDPNSSGDLTPSGEAVVAFAGMAAQSALYQNQLSDLRARLGEVRNQNNAGIWTSVSTQREHFDSFNQIGFVQDTYRFNLGYDKRYGNWLIGANIKYHNADQKTNKSHYLAKGNAEDIGFNTYATWLNDDGYYLDFIISADRYHQEIHTNMLDSTNVSGSYHNLGLGISVEGGRKICFDNRLFIEPQAQIGYYYLWGDDFSLSNGMTVKQDDFKSLVSRLGAVFGKDFFDANQKYLGQIYLQAGTRYEALGENSISINGYDFENDNTAWVFYYGVGGEVNIQDNLKVYGYARREEGDGYHKNFDIMLGAKYMF